MLDPKNGKLALGAPPKSFGEISEQLTRSLLKMDFIEIHKMVIRNVEKTSKKSEKMAHF